MFELTIKSHFAASHLIKGHRGKCKNLHGHTWKVDVVVAGEKLDSIGVIVDFKDIKQRLERLLENLDHSHLNELPFFKNNNPTTENIAKLIFEQFAKKCRPLQVHKVTVWESDSAGVTYKKD